MNEKRNVNVIGYGRLLIQPDYTKLIFKLNSKNVYYKHSLEELNVKVSYLTNALLELGFLRDEIKTEDYRIREDSYYNDKSRTYCKTGYEGIARISVSYPRDDEKTSSILGELIDVIHDVGIEINFFRFDFDSIEEKLIELAFEDAKKKAKAIEKFSGVKLKHISNINYERSSSTPSFLKEEIRRCQLTQHEIPMFNPEDEEIEREIYVEWEIE